MIYTIKAKDRHTKDFGWLKSCWLFSFGDYEDPANQDFGNLRVYNDDVVGPGSGFPDHPHANYEIVTIVFSGELTHRDDMGNTGTLADNDVQRMSAGEGIVHSEMNHGKSPVHLHQLWFYPDSDTHAGYKQKTFEPKPDGITTLVTKTGVDGSLTFNVDASIQRAICKEEHIFASSVKEGRGLFVYVKNGSVAVNDIALEAGDQARITGPEKVELWGQPGADFMMIEVKM